MGWVKDNIIDPITGKSQRDAIKDATAAQTAAGQEAIQLQRETTEQARQDLQPFREFGQRQIYGLQGAFNQPIAQFQFDDPSTIADDPLFNTLFGEAERAITARNAAAGKLNSGDTLKDLTNASMAIGADIFNQNQNRKLQQFGVNQGAVDNRVNQLFNALIQGQNAAAGQGTATLQSGNNMADLLTQIGNVQGSGAIGQANARVGGINNIVGLATKAAGAFL